MDKENNYIMRTKNKDITPFLKWVGGKRQLIPEIEKLIPKTIANYYEPFVGAGAVLFHIQPEKAVINDINNELINVYQIIKNNVEDLITDLKTHKNEADYFYAMRSLDREADFAKISDIKRASRVIYLNKTCFNGLYRVNSAGEFNTPFGRYINPNIVNEVTLRAVSSYFNKNNVKILHGDYLEVLKNLEQDAFVYLDPPYYPISQSSNFTGYSQNGFNEKNQQELRDACNALNKKGIKFLLSNSATQFIENLYCDYPISYVKANRAINSNGNKRGKIDEVLIRNYE